ncbi:hypothetical protein [Bradyrhizobium sp. AZCC 2289]|uniref:hypothetical protein n=1 Tax=Bradyrhizobium sp. AZCC 2289 TaxID=3117026 RepID=UPI002FF0B357
MFSPEICSLDFVQTSGTRDGFAGRGNSSAIADAGIVKMASARTILILSLLLKCEIWRLQSNNVKFLESALHMCRQPYQRRQACDKRITPVSEVELERLGQEYCCASGWAALLPGKRPGGAPEQEDTANPSPGFTNDPEALVVLPDEECRDRLTDDVGI